MDASIDIISSKILFSVEVFVKYCLAEQLDSMEWRKSDKLELPHSQTRTKLYETLNGSNRRFMYSSIDQMEFSFPSNFQRNSKKRRRKNRHSLGTEKVFTFRMANIYLDTIVQQTQEKHCVPYEQSISIQQSLVVCVCVYGLKNKTIFHHILFSMCFVQANDFKRFW